MKNQNDIPTIDELDALERTIVKGLKAYDLRNELICRLVENGVKQADIARRLNTVRVKMDAPSLTPDAVAATLKRAEKRAKGDL
jgi:hypothetical protein